MFCGYSLKQLFCRISAILVNIAAQTYKTRYFLIEIMQIISDRGQNRAENRQKGHVKMIIEKQRVGAHGHTTIYRLCNSIADTGAAQPDEIARFETLELATVVMRYMRGDSLSEADEYRAKEAIKKADAPTD